MRAFSRVATPFGVRANATVAASIGIPKSAVGQASAPYLLWTEQNVINRPRLETIGASYDGKTDFSQKRHELMARGAKAPAAPASLKEAVSKAKSLADIADAFEATMLPVRKLEEERSKVQLAIWEHQDKIGLGLKALSPEKLEAYKKEIVTLQKQMDENRKKLVDYSKKAFDTATCNEIVNAFRIAGEHQSLARAYAEYILEDLATASVTFDETTKLLLKNVIFGDMPHEDSNLLFTFVENPERGEVSLAPAADGNLSAIADDAIETIGRRHTTPVTGAQKLQQTDTHPMLQRSPE
jgi:hypothetical protein